MAKNILTALIRFVLSKWSKPRYIEASVSFFEIMTTSEQKLKEEMAANGFDLNRPIEKEMLPSDGVYIYRQEIK